MSIKTNEDLKIGNANKKSIAENLIRLENTRNHLK